MALIPFRSIRQMLAIFFLKLNSKRLYRSSGKEKESRRLAFTSSAKHEIRHFHVVVVRWRERNVQKSLMHEKSCCFANLNLLLFCRSRWRRCRRFDGPKSLSSPRLRWNNEGTYTAAPNLRLRPWDWVGVEITLWTLWENEFWPSSVLCNLVITEKHGESETNVPWCNSRQRRASLLLGHKMADSLNMRKNIALVLGCRFFPHTTPSKFELLS